MRSTRRIHPRSDLPVSETETNGEEGMFNNAIYNPETVCIVYDNLINCAPQDAPQVDRAGFKAAPMCPTLKRTSVQQAVRVQMTDSDGSIIAPLGAAQYLDRSGLSSRALRSRIVFACSLQVHYPNFRLTGPCADGIIKCLTGHPSLVEQ